MDQVRGQPPEHSVGGAFAAYSGVLADRYALPVVVSGVHAHHGWAVSRVGDFWQLTLITCSDFATTIAVLVEGALIRSQHPKYLNSAIDSYSIR
ncbi:hypothetical protein [Woeseia oceani]|uniref:Uncharacterized protein n=1 Tax=Woeseia oceani TaxID=1548547 RepID=A0A193LJG0_9GAMM|nr:hypothetical protein [Woeseia oceani]ANO52534.1 hypothetical protein BA177_16295 [Woeseia oceani]